MTQREFSKRIGLTHGTVARLELGEQNVTIETLEKICRTLRCDIDELLI